MIATRVAELLEAPDAHLVIDQARAILNDEANRRRAFREWLKDDFKAEFINGEVIMQSPVKRRHLNSSGNLTTLLRVYVQVHDLGEVDTEKALVGMSRNDYEPDICFWNKEIASTFDDDMVVHPAPDLIVEILSKSTASKDRGIKFEDYAAHGVREYWIIDPVRKSIEQNELDPATMAFTPVKTHYIDDTITSLTIAGFTIPVRAAFEKRANLLALKELFDEK